VAAKLALAGEQVMALSSMGPLKSIEVAESGELQTVEFTRFDGPADMLAIAVKAPALAAAAEAIQSLAGPDTLIVPMLNGVPWWFVAGEPLRSIDPGGNIARTFPLDRVVGCVVHASCSRSARNRVDVKHADKLIIGEPDGETSERASRLFAYSNAQACVRT
jgi:ketopantoate reductase